ncbi:hypothetical protein BDZ89DRAFT_1143533 [Hymenopellis radicata]|nr:hypothetical protein BDZ89DRAFT_1143533 [Hymenopellis radicata]
MLRRCLNLRVFKQRSVRVIDIIPVLFQANLLLIDREFSASMLFSALTVLAVSAITFASPAVRAPLDFGPNSTSVMKGREAVARGHDEYGDEDHHWNDKDCFTGYLNLTTYDGKDYGYVGNNVTWYGAYTIASCDEDRLLVQIDEFWPMSGYFDMQTLNGPDSWNPYLAGLVGFASGSDNLGKGSYNYFYIGGAASPTPPGSPAQPVANTFTDLTDISKNVETAIWHSFDTQTKCFDVPWTNSDHSFPETIIGVYEEGKSH